MFDVKIYKLGVQNATPYTIINHSSSRDGSNISAFSFLGRRTNNNARTTTRCIAAATMNGSPAHSPPSAKPTLNRPANVGPAATTPVVWTIEIIEYRRATWLGSTKVVIRLRTRDSKPAESVYIMSPTTMEDTFGENAMIRHPAVAKIMLRRASQRSLRLLLKPSFTSIKVLVAGKTRRSRTTFTAENIERRNPACASDIPYRLEAYSRRKFACLEPIVKMKKVGSRRSKRLLKIKSHDCQVLWSASWLLRRFWFSRLLNESEDSCGVSERRVSSSCRISLLRGMVSEIRNSRMVPAKHTPSPRRYGAQESLSIIQAETGGASNWAMKVTRWSCRKAVALWKVSREQFW